jgi:hypothetical protein
MPGLIPRDKLPRNPESLITGEDLQKLWEMIIKDRDDEFFD